MQGVLDGCQVTSSGLSRLAGRRRLSGPIVAACQQRLGLSYEILRVTQQARPRSLLCIQSSFVNCPEATRRTECGQGAPGLSLVCWIVWQWQTPASSCRPDLSSSTVRHGWSRREEAH